MNNVKSGFINKKRIIVIAIILAVIAAGIGVYVFLPGKSAREFYFQAEGKNFKKYADQVKKSYKDFYDSQQPYMTGIYKKRTELTVNIGGNEKAFGLKNAEGVFDLVRRCKLVSDTKTNTSDKTSVTALSLLLEKTPFIDAEIVSKDRQLYFTVPVLTPDRYFTLNKDKLDEVYERFNIPVRPVRLLSLTDTANTIKFADADFDRVAADFGEYISEFISENNVKYGKKVELTISGQKAAGREVFVSLDANKCSDLMKGLAKKASGDDTLLKLTYGNFADLAMMLDEAGVFDLFDFLDKNGTVVLNKSEKSFLNAINIKKNIAGFQKELSDALSGFNFTEGVEMALIIDKSGNILDRKTSVVLEDTISGNRYKADVHTGSSSVKYNDCRNRFMDIAVDTIPVKGNSSRQYLKISSALTPPSKAGDGNGTIEISFGGGAEGALQSATSVKLDIDSSIDSLTLKKTNVIKYSIGMQGANAGVNDTVSGKVDTVSWKNDKLKTKNWNSSLTINADIPSFNVKNLTAKLTLAKEDKFDLALFTLPDVQTADTVDLNKATDAELVKVWNGILASFGSFYITNKPIIDAVMGDQ